MTNELILIGKLACDGDTEYKSVYQSLRDHHLKTLIELASSQDVSEVEAEMKGLLDELVNGSLKELVEGIVEEKCEGNSQGNVEGNFERIV